MAPERVGFLHTAAWQLSPPAERIRLYVEALGLPTDLSADDARDRLEKEFTEPLTAFWEAVGAAEKEDRSAVYEAKNVSLNFSLLMGALGRGDFHRFTMECVLQGIPIPKKVLDAGCDNGLLTCFYGLLWPQATIVGFDICRLGIVRARELAAFLEVANVTFIEGSLEQLAAMPGQNGFDLVLTTTFLQEACYFPPTPERTFAADALLDDRLTEASPVYRIVESMMRPKGALWLGAEILQKPHLLWHWLAAIKAVGLHVEPILSRRVECGGDLATIVVATRDAQPPVTANAAKEFWNCGPLPIWSPDDALPASYSGMEAQFIFESIANKKLNAVSKLWPPESPDNVIEASRAEIWTTGTLAIFHQCDWDMGVEITLCPVADIDKIREVWEQAARCYEESGCQTESWIDG